MSQQLSNISIPSKQADSAQFLHESKALNIVQMDSSLQPRVPLVRDTVTEIVKARNLLEFNVDLGRVYEVEQLSIAFESKSPSTKVWVSVSTRDFSLRSPRAAFKQIFSQCYDENQVYKVCRQNLKKQNILRMGELNSIDKLQINLSNFSDPTSGLQERFFRVQIFIEESAKAPIAKFNSILLYPFFYGLPVSNPRVPHCHNQHLTVEKPVI